MDVMEQAIVKMLKNGQMHAGDVRNRLNGLPLGLDVSLDDVLRALRRLEGQFVVECLWGINEVPFVKA